MPGDQLAFQTDTNLGVPEAAALMAGGVGQDLPAAPFNLFSKLEPELGDIAEQFPGCLIARVSAKASASLALRTG